MRLNTIRIEKNRIKSSALRISIFLLSCLYGCNSSTSSASIDSTIRVRAMNDSGLRSDSLQARILQFGDTNAYKLLRMELILESPKQDVLKWSKIMIDKYALTGACTDYFQSAIDYCDPPGLECLNRRERDTAIAIINKAILKGDSLAMRLKKEYVK